MPDQTKDRHIEYLIEKLQDADLDNRAMHLVMEDFLKQQAETNARLAQYDVGLQQLEDTESLLEKERKARKALELEIARLKEQLEFANQNRFGSKKQSVKENKKY